ncbi:M55 family metallopeptidase [Streptomyces fumanus]|uniref:M55 family metallopeptidase n=1 Tax=Streptomyces fumanus TaxID=67302 RepID=UPI001E4526F7|nr:M55 family metallopeptidase [Streptomyces fumanus]
MRVYISADMEGVTGLVDADDVQPGGRDYERGRLMMAEDVNAAVRGALAAGATDITVNDAHGPMRNLRPETLHPAARLIRGRPKNMGMLEGLVPDHDALVCVGYHSRAGALGVLSHSFMGHEIEDMWLDGRPVGEIGLAHATAAAVGVPMVVLTGDDAACAETAEWDAAVTTVAVKYARDRFAADLRPVEEARTAIEEAVAAGLAVLDLVRAGMRGPIRQRSLLRTVLCSPAVEWSARSVLVPSGLPTAGARGLTARWRRRGRPGGRRCAARRRRGCRLRRP